MAVSIDSVIEEKLDALAAIESQFYEGGANGSAELLPLEPDKQTQRRRQVKEGFAARDHALVERFRDQLARWYGVETAAKTEFAEAFEIGEYGRQPTREELRRLFPFFPGS